MSEVSRSLSGQTTMFSTFHWSRAQIRTNNARAISDCNPKTPPSKLHKILLTRGFSRVPLTSNTRCIAYKSYTSTAKCNTLRQRHFWQRNWNEWKNLDRICTFVDISIHLSSCYYGGTISL